MSFLGTHKSDLVCIVLRLYYLSDEDVPLFLTFAHFRENWDASLHNRLKNFLDFMFYKWRSPSFVGLTLEGTEGFIYP